MDSVEPYRCTKLLIICAHRFTPFFLQHLDAKITSFFKNNKKDRYVTPDACLVFRGTFFVLSPNENVKEAWENILRGRGTFYQFRQTLYDLTYVVGEKVEEPTWIRELYYVTQINIIYISKTFHNIWTGLSKVVVDNFSGLIYETFLTGKTITSHRLNTGRRYIRDVGTDYPIVPNQKRKLLENRFVRVIKNMEALNCSQMYPIYTEMHSLTHMVTIQHDRFQMRYNEYLYTALSRVQSDKTYSLASFTETANVFGHLKLVPPMSASFPLQDFYDISLTSLQSQFSVFRLDTNFNVSLPSDTYTFSRLADEELLPIFFYVVDNEAEKIRELYSKLFRRWMPHSTYITFLEDILEFLNSKPLYTTMGLNFKRSLWQMMGAFFFKPEICYGEALTLFKLINYRVFSGGGFFFETIRWFFAQKLKVQKDLFNLVDSVEKNELWFFYNYAVQQLMSNMGFEAKRDCLYRILNDHFLPPHHEEQKTVLDWLVKSAQAVSYTRSCFFVALLYNTLAFVLNQNNLGYVKDPNQPLKHIMKKVELLKRDLFQFLSPKYLSNLKKHLNERQLFGVVENSVKRAMYLNSTTTIMYFYTSDDQMVLYKYIKEICESP